MNKYFHNFLMGVSVLPALAIMPADATIDPGKWFYARAEDMVVTENVNLACEEDFAIWADNAGNTDAGGTITINAETVDAWGAEGAILSMHRTESGPNEHPSRVSIVANTINLSGNNADGYGIVSAMSQGIINLSGNTTITANQNANNDAILARGKAQVIINKDVNKTLKMDGDMDFNFNGPTSGTGVDALVDVTLSGSGSYWNGNVVVSYDEGAPKPSDAKLELTDSHLTIKNGAVWNASKITDVENGGNNGGRYYHALNYLTIANGTVNIADTDRGLAVESANIANATFNGGMLNVGNFALTGGTNTFNNDIVGIDDSSSLNIGSNATMNIGTNTVNVKNITLDGTMAMTLRDGDAQITAGTFDGDGTLNLTLSGEGTYHVFGNAVFANAKNSVYDLEWNGGDVTATMKSVEDIAEEAGIAQETAAVVAGASQSTSEKLNDLAVKMQEKLAEETAEAKQEVEKAAAAIHPEKESVTQSIAASVQTTVANLTGARMRMVAPRIGRNGGDARLTAGGIWAQGLFNKSKQNDAFSGYTRGIAAGMDGTINNVWTIGAGYSYAHSDISGTERDTEIDSNTIFVYGQYKPTQWYVNAMLNYTMSDFTEDGVVMGTPVKGDYDADSFGGVVATGYDFASGVTPELGLRYMHVMVDDYTNSMDVKTKSKDTDFLTGVFGAKYTFGINMDRYTKLIPQLNAAVKYDMLSDRNMATVTMPGVDSYTLRGERLSRLGGEFGIGLGLKYKTLDFSINYDIDVRKDYTSQTGMLKFRYNF